MKITKTRNEFFGLLDKLETLKDLQGIKVSYAIMRIKDAIRRETVKAKAIVAPSEAYIAFDKERNEIAKSYADKDALGNPVVTGNEYQMSEENKAEFDKKFEEMKAEHKGVFEEREKQRETIEAFLSEETELDFHDIRKADLPENITVSQMEVLAPFVVDLES